MRAEDIAKRILVAILALSMMFTYMPAAAFAEPLPEEAAAQTEPAKEGTEAASAASETDERADVKESHDEEEPEQKEASSFKGEVKLDDVIIRADAEAGAFPEDAELSAEKAGKKDEKEAAEAVDEVRAAGLNVAESYTFDIRVLDAEGNELQPADGKAVNVSFVMDRAADRNLGADIYHITEKEDADEEDKKDGNVLEAEKLDAGTDRKGSAVAAMTDGFSLYTVEFTYSDLNYEMAVDSEDSGIRANEITGALGLAGEIEDIIVSKEELFSASKESGEWIVRSHKSFDTEETMTVTINEVQYVIKVTSDDGSIKVDTWAGMKAAINSVEEGQTIKLTSDITAGSGEERFAITRGVSFTIDLAGHGIDRDLSSKNENNKGHVFDVNRGTLTIKDSAGGGKLTGGSDENGGAVVIGEHGILNIEDVEISGNRATEEGGGIFVYGRLNMKNCVVKDNSSRSGGGVSVHKGGVIQLDDATIRDNSANNCGGGISNKGIAELTNCTISGNKAGNEGGGITVYGRFTMTGGAVSGNKAEDAGGVYNEEGTLSMNGVAIKGNTTTKYGGAGINNKGNAAITGCTFEGNRARSTGGGIYADHDITVTGCTFENNVSDSCGGAVRMYDCTAVIGDCTMKGNSAAEYGGAVYIDDGGKADIRSTAITEGTAYKGGSGIYVGGKGTLDLGGVSTVTGNKATDVYLTSGKKINITSALKSGTNKSQIGVILKDQEGVITSGYGEFNEDTDPYEYFTPEIGCSIILNNGEVEYLPSRWGYIQHRISTAKNGDVINLEWDIKAKAEDRTLTVPEGKIITVNLNGHTLDRGLSSYAKGGEVFTVNGTLTIKDSKGGGRVTGGYGTGGGVLVNSGGAFTLEGGSITENKAGSNGGGILVMEGAEAEIKTDEGSAEAPEVEGNSAPKGAGVYSAGILKVRKDTSIINNNASESGGGLYIAGGTVYLSGSITGNSAADDAGGIWHGADASLAVQGAPVVADNTAAVAANIGLKGGSVITVESLSDESSGKNAKLDVTADAAGPALTAGLTESSSAGKAPLVFTYNGAAYAGTLEIGEDGELHHREVTADVWVSDWQGLQDAINAPENQEKVIGLKNDITAGSGDKCQFADGKNVIIELNGHVINRNLSDDKSDGNVFRLKGGSVLTVRDGIGTGVLKGGRPAGDGGAVLIEGGSTFILEGGTIKGNRSTRDGGAVYVDDGFLRITGGTIADNRAGDEGGAVYSREDGAFDISNATISSNTADGGGGAIKAHLEKNSTVRDSIIRKNRSDSTGGAINMEEGGKTLTVENTIIKDNTAGEEAGGIYIDEGTVRMNGGELSNNSGKDAGGIMVSSGDTFIADGVTITGNTSRDESGGGVNNHGTASLSDCIINNNTAGESGASGGGVYNKSEMTMTGCTLSGNRSNNEGGAVFNKGNITIKDCAMTNNKSDEGMGGAVCQADKRMTIDGGSITGNEGRGGNGIYANTEVQIMGALVVRDNEYQNVYLNDKKLKVVGALKGSDIHVTMSKETGTFTTGYKNNNTDAQSGAEIEPWYYFVPDDDSYSVIMDDNGEAMIAESEWPQLQKLIDDKADSAEDGGETPVLVLDRSWQAKKSDVPLTIPAGRSIIIDLNGFTIDRNRESKSRDGQVFVLDPGNALTIRDSSEAKTGTIKGGWAENGGAVYLAAKTDDRPAPSLSVESGSIVGNKADNGGAIYMAEADSPENGAEVDLTGGIISGNLATVEAGGIWAGETGTLKVSGMPFVLGNNGGAGNNIMLGTGNLLRVTGTLTVGSGSSGGAVDTAALDLTAKSSKEAEGTGVRLTEGLAYSKPEGSTTEEYAKAIFTYNGTGYEASLEIKNGELCSKDVRADAWVSDWAALQAYVNDKDHDGKTVGLSRDIDAGRDNYSIKVDGDKINTVTIELNGHRMDRKRSSAIDDGHVINVKDGATLLIRDSVGTGIITGGNSSDYGGGIKIEKDSKCIIDGGSVSGNKAKPDGGGIYVKGTLVMTGGTVSNNHASDTAGGICCADTGSFDLKNATISGNTSENDGGGFIVHLGSDAFIENCLILNNESKTEDGGAMRVECNNKTLTITDSTISGNRAENDGGGMVIYAGKVIMRGGSVSDNSSEDGAGVYNNDGSIDFYNVRIDGNTSTKRGGAGINNRNNAMLENCEITNNVGKADGGGIYTKHQMTVKGGRISGNSAEGDGGGIFNTDDGTCLIGVGISENSAKKDGGGIFTDEDMTITGCTLAYNKAKADGGGIRIKDCRASLENCGINDNEAAEEGGGIYINDGSAKLDLNGGTITGNSAQTGGGLYVNDGTDDVFIKGNIGIYDNIAYGDVYLTKGEKLTVTGPLSSGEGSTESSRIGIVAKDGTEKDFTKDYSKHNPGTDPAAVFYSNDKFIVYLKDGKEAAFRESRAMIDDNPFIEVNSQMERYVGSLNGSNWMSGISGERYLSEVNMPGTHDSGTKKVQGNVTTSRITWIGGGVGGVIGGIIGGFAGATAGPIGLAIGASIGLAIGGFIGAGATYTSLEDYAVCQKRYIDEQLEDGVRRFDLRVNTCHVEAAVSSQDNGKDLWILHGENPWGGTYYAKRSNGDTLTLAKVFDWYKEFLREHPTETIIIEISTQGIDLDEDAAKERLTKHLRTLAQEINPSTGKPYLYTENGDYTNISFTAWPQLKDCRGQIIYGLDSGTGLDTVYKVSGGYEDDAKAKNKNLKAFYEQYGFDSLPETGNNGSKYFDYYMTAGTNGTDEPSNTPMDIADEVLPTLFDRGGLLTDRQGKFIGLVNMDGVTSKIARQVWITNFFSGLKYCTVTAKASEEDNNPKTYTVLSETPIVIPECIYPDPNSAGENFWYWKATDNEGNPAGIYYPGDPFTVMEDVTFTAVWEEPDTSSIRAVWVDGNDADGIRPKKLTVVVTKAREEGKEAETEQVTLTEDNKVWRKDLDYPASEVDPVEPDKYTSDVKGTRITLYHTPEKAVRASGNIVWRDNDDAGGLRPSCVTLSLYADGEQIKQVTVSKEGGWAYDLGSLPLYSYDAEKNAISRIDYKLAETGVPAEYSAYVSGLIESGSKTGFEITNTLTSSKEMILGHIHWYDEENDGAARPDKVTLNLYAGGKKVSSKEIGAEEDGVWLFDFEKDPAIDYSDYKITVDPIQGYSTTVYMGTEESGVIIVATLESHQHDEQELTTVFEEAKCDEPGLQVTTRFCMTCGAVFDVKMEEISPLGHEWGKWNTKKTATETEDGLEERVCIRNPDHVESRVVPKTRHEHESVRVAAKAATCTTDGNIAYYYCSECGWYYTDEDRPDETWIAHGDEVVPAKGHDWDKWEVIREATETENGTEQRICRYDSSHKETRSIPAKNHEHRLRHVEAKDPGCTEDGNIEYWICGEGDKPCGLCFRDSDGKEPVDKADTVIPAIGHEWTDWEAVTPATDTEEGLERRSCKHDPDEVEERNIPKTSHTHHPEFVQKTDPTCTTEGNIAYYYCEECGWCFKDGAHPGTTWFKRGEEVLPIDPDAHDWSPWKETKAPTDTEEGEEERTCSRCGRTESRAVPKVDPSMISYRVTEGNEQTWYRGSSDTADFTFKRSVNDKTTYSHFRGIKVDGRDITSANYTKESGSVIIRLKPKYLEKLENGRHTITAEFDDGSAGAAFKLAEKSGDKDEESGSDPSDDSRGKDKGSASGGSNSSGSGSNSSGAGTGDSSTVLIWLAIVLAAMLALVVSLAIRRRRPRS